MRDAPCLLGLAGEDRPHWPDGGTEGVILALSSRDLVRGSVVSQCVTEHLGVHHLLWGRHQTRSYWSGNMIMTPLETSPPVQGVKQAYYGEFPSKLFEEMADRQCYSHVPMKSV